MCSGTEAGSYLRLIDSCVTQRKAQGPSRTCKKSKEEDEKKGYREGVLEHELEAREAGPLREREFCIDNLLVRTHFIINMIWWTGLAPRKFELLFLGSLISTFLGLFLLLLSAAFQRHPVAPNLHPKQIPINTNKYK